jgi:hypothetical protein
MRPASVCLQRRSNALIVFTLGTAAGPAFHTRAHLPLAVVHGRPAAAAEAHGRPAAAVVHGRPAAAEAHERPAAAVVHGRPAAAEAQLPGQLKVD